MQANLTLGGVTRRGDAAAQREHVCPRCRLGSGGRPGTQVAPGLLIRFSSQHAYSSQESPEQYFLPKMPSHFIDGEPPSPTPILAAAESGGTSAPSCLRPLWLLGWDSLP